MIIIYHQKNKIVEVENDQGLLKFQDKNPVVVLFEAAEKFENQFIIWCHIDLKDNLSLKNLKSVFHHKKIMASYNPGHNSFLPNSIGYVDGAPFLKINKNVAYPTWMMSSWVGGIHASILKVLKKDFCHIRNLGFFLISLAKKASDEGLLCYSEPKLLKDKSVTVAEFKEDFFILFQFVKQNYKAQWTFFLFICLTLFERKFKFLPLLWSFFFKNKKLTTAVLDNIEVISSKNVVELGTIDVIIPTIGRKKYLYDVLKDLAVQTHLPVNVIIIEQNPNPESSSELDYLTSEDWPFTIKHTFTNQSGACNARNLALNQVESEWVFLNDDDNRFGSDLLENVLSNLKRFGLQALTTSYLQTNEIKKDLRVKQHSFFGSGNSFICSNVLNKVKFDMKFEFGYGEDIDFGMQLRNIGTDIIYFPNLEILHLKAPIGGFRTKPVLRWSSDPIQPKPSPTVMLCKQLHLTINQVSAYKFILLLKFYKVQKIKNPILYYANFKKQWRQSLYWMNNLRNS
ncbi:glycosyltransferase family 2 protein [Flavobacterium foetidum]|uniref:glycosyltransferase family 2 protein n=1 Tax=Flavobacterium foetidum TaxID=2026681 RepID=UPI001075108C|nr:glycosyltransferase family A protein [Flavobacterium foetidum]KAF2513569.1 glycosyltransferase family 2 protein [Flavobacterium foetidum]